MIVALVSSWAATMISRISSVERMERSASLRTSDATTAKPLPASPARAASMAALSASRLVCCGDVGDQLQHLADLLAALAEGQRALGDRLDLVLHVAHRVAGLVDGARPGLGVVGDRARRGVQLLDGRGDLGDRARDCWLVAVETCALAASISCAEPDSVSAAEPDAPEPGELPGCALELLVEPLEQPADETPRVERGEDRREQRQARQQAAGDARLARPRLRLVGRLGGGGGAPLLEDPDLLLGAAHLLVEGRDARGEVLRAGDGLDPLAEDAVRSPPGSRGSPSRPRRRRPACG